MKRALATFVRVFVAFVVVIAAISVFMVARNLGWLSPLGLKSESSDSQVIVAMERTQEVSLLSLKVQGIKKEKRCSTIFGKCIPASGDTILMQFNFAAKLGIDGSQVKVTKTGEKAYRITVPKFIFIGYDDPTFQVVAKDGSLLDFITPDIDEAKLINNILSEKARNSYITGNEDLLQDQTKLFYESLIKSIDPELETSFEFVS